MIKKHTKLIPSDKCGFWQVKSIHLYKGFSRKTSYAGNFIRVSIKKVKPLFWKEKGKKYSSIIVRTCKENLKADGSFFFFKYNSSVTLKKRLTPVGKELYGPCSSLIFRKKFLVTFAGII